MFALQNKAARVAPSGTISAGQLVHAYAIHMRFILYKTTGKAIEYLVHYLHYNKTELSLLKQGICGYLQDRPQHHHNKILTKINVGL